MHLFNSNTQYILASSSKYRKALLEKLGMPIACIAPNIDESALDFETAQATSTRLAIEKTQAVLKQLQSTQSCVIIGSDQILMLEDTQLGKPMNRENAVKQLQQMRGKHMQFYTAMHMLYINGEHTQTFSSCDVIDVKLRNYTDNQIDRYLNHEQSYDCAGTIKTETIGIALIESLSSQDPNAIIGLSLIQVVNGLKQFGLMRD